jgi:hypothetical protein
MHGGGMEEGLFCGIIMHKNECNNQYISSKGIGISIRRDQKMSNIIERGWTKPHKLWKETGLRERSV